MAQPLTEKDVVVAPELPDVLPARKPLKGFWGYCRKNPAIAIGAGIVLVGSTFLRIRQVAKERSTTAEGGQPAECRYAMPMDGTGVPVRGRP